MATVDVAAALLTVGFGGAAGRAGPIVQLGSAVGSGVAQLARLATGRVRTLVACGAAGGVAAAFNAPLAGAAFSLEIVVGRVRSDVLILPPLLAATAGSVWVSHRLSPFSIYTLKLHRRGVAPPGQEERAGGQVKESDAGVA